MGLNENEPACPLFKETARVRPVSTLDDIRCFRVSSIASKTDSIQSKSSKMVTNKSTTTQFNNLLVSRTILIVLLEQLEQHMKQLKGD